MKTGFGNIESIFSQSWNNYWKRRSVFWSKSRSGLSLLDQFGHNATIIPVCGKTVKASGAANCSYIQAPVSSKDLNFTEMTIEAIVEFRTLPNDNVNIFGRNRSGIQEGDVNLYITNAGGNLISFSTYDTSYRIMDSVGIQINTRYHIIGTIKPIVGMKLCVNGVDKGSDTYRAVQASTEEPFASGAYTVANGIATSSGWGDMNLFTCRLYNVCLTDEEKTLRESGIDVARGLILSWDFMGGHGSTTEHDRSGQDNHGTWVGNQPTYYGYSQYGCQDNLNNGYKRYHKLGTFPLYLPKLIGGNSYPSSPSFPTGYVEWGEITGSSIVHNLAASKIRFPSQTIFDRSNTTTNNAQSRTATNYDSGNVTDWHIWEAANYNIIASYLNSGYKGRIFPKNTWAQGLDGISRPVSLYELILCTNDQTGRSLIKALTYTGND